MIILLAFITLDFSLIYKNPSLAKSLWYNELALLFVYALKSGIVEYPKKLAIPKK